MSFFNCYRKWIIAFRILTHLWIELKRIIIWIKCIHWYICLRFNDNIILIIVFIVNNLREWNWQILIFKDGVFLKIRHKKRRGVGIYLDHKIKLRVLVLQSTSWQYQGHLISYYLIIRREIIRNCLILQIYNEILSWHRRTTIWICDL